MSELLLPETLLVFASASLLLAVAPGPDNIFVLSQSAVYGAKSGLTVTAGLCSGLVVHTLAVASGVATIFQTSLFAFTVLKLFGVAYLLHLGWKSLRSKKKQLADTAIARSPSGKSLIFRGFLMNITNPKVSIFFLAFLPQFINLNKGAVFLQTLSLGVVFILCAILVFGAISYFAGFLNAYSRRQPRFHLLLDRLAGVVFVGLAIRLATVKR